MDSSSLSRNIKIISTYIDRQNIRLSVIPVKQKSFKTVSWICEILIKQNTAKVSCWWALFKISEGIERTYYEFARSKDVDWYVS